MELSVVLREPGSCPPRSGETVWQTCLREIAFTDDRLPVSGQLLRGEAAYAHLLEVICGLGSPIVGETEVMYQFKQFVAGLAPGQAELRALGNRLLTDARAIRAQHLIGLGSRSYGSAVRRQIRGASRVAIIGTGILAKQVLPFVADDGRRVDLWGRRETAPIGGPGIVYRHLTKLGAFVPESEPAALVVAAPVTAAVIEQVANRYSTLTRLVDLRAEGTDDPPPPMAPVVTLRDVFDEVTRAAAGSARSVAAARIEIQRRAGGYGSRETLRPSGWHDLCA